jgi:hypothetical protein
LQSIVLEVPAGEELDREGLDQPGLEDVPWQGKKES